MRRYACAAVPLLILSIWMQIVAPVAAMAMHRTVDPFSIVCKSTRPDGHVPTPVDHHPQHEHCLLCQAGFHGAPLVDAPTVFRPKDPVVVRRGTHFAELGAKTRDRRRRSQSRGPPQIL